MAALSPLRLLLALLVCACAAAAAAPSVSRPVPSAVGQTQPAQALAVRVLGAALAKRIGFAAECTAEGSPLCFSVRDATSAEACDVVIGGTTPIEMASGLNWYLNNRLNASVTWNKTGGSTVPQKGFPVPLPPVGKPVRVEKSAPISYYLNVVTVSYSAVWWDFARWEQEIDWMALNGVNLALAYTGQEYVYRKVYKSLGVNDTALASFFDGPAFLAWSRGQGMAGVGGPLPEQWYEQQWQLQKQIVARQTELGVASLLPAFQGNVPPALKEAHPSANISHGWLDAFDPLFKTVASKVMTELIADFGATHWYQADGWFTQNTGPWVDGERDAACAFSKAQPNTYLADCASDCRAFGSLSEAEKACAADQGCGGVTASAAGKSFELRAGVQPQPSPANETSWYITNAAVCHPVQPDEDAKARAELVWSTLHDADPEAMWVYQGWIWLGLNNPKGQSYIKGFTSGVPAERLVILDMEAESSPLWTWSHSLCNASFVLAFMDNFGGNNGLYGDLTRVVQATQNALQNSTSIVGVGITMEGIDQNPAYYALCLESAWMSATQAFDAAKWMVGWGRNRCGRATADVDRAYAALANTVYQAGQQHTLHHFYATEILPLKTMRPWTGGYNTTVLKTAFASLLQAEAQCGTEAVGFDLVDVGRELLLVTEGACAYNCMMDAFGNKSAAGIRSAGARLAAVVDDLDRLLTTQQGFLMGEWIAEARTLGASIDAADFLEWNARSQVTLWEPYRLDAMPASVPGLSDYATKIWGGLAKYYHGARLALFADMAAADIEKGGAFDQDKFVAAFLQLAVGFENAAWNTTELPPTPQGSRHGVASEMLHKYGEKLSCSCASG